MDHRLQRLIDEADIRRVLALYARGVDRLDAELIGSVYCEESTDDHGTYKGGGKEFGTYVTDALRQHAEATAHNLNQSIIEIHDEAARAETYFVAYHVRKAQDGEYLDRFGGRYLDELVKRDGEWQIMDRVVVRDWSATDKIEGAHYSADDFVNGRRSREDLAYRPFPA
jgi:hypothetical protein